MTCCVRTPAASPYLLSCGVFLSAILGAGLNYADERTPGVKPGPEQIATLVAELGHERFSKREAASDKLARIGLPAFAALEEASRHADREVRFRAQRILSVIRKNDLERRLAAFVAGTGKEDYELPAWDRFQKGFGDSELSRRMFVQMQRADPELLSALARDPRAAVESLGRTLQERFTASIRGVNQAAPPVSAGELSAFLFVAGEDDAPVSASSLTLLLQLCWNPTVADAIRSPKDGELTRKMLGNVVRRCEGEAAGAALRLSNDFELKEGLAPALKVLESNGKWNATSGQTAIMALACVVKLGDASHVPTVEKQLENHNLVSTSSVRVIKNNEPVTITRQMQVRDAALAALVMLTKQDLKGYCEDAGISRVSASPYQPFQPQIIGFQSDDKRQAALSKWAAYKERQKQRDAVAKPAPAELPPPTELSPPSADKPDQSPAGRSP